MRRRLLQLVLGSLLLWLALAGPAWLWWGEEALVYTAAACLLCLAPMAATLVWCMWSLPQSPEQAVTAVFGGTAVRMLFVLAGSVLLYLNVESFHQPAFLFWVIGFYLATLSLEVVVIARATSATGPRRS
jgi:hypothetical protein